VAFPPGVFDQTSKAEHRAKLLTLPELDDSFNNRLMRQEV
jgi:hypothetical protein